jgi:hypothetical protein
MRVDAEQTPLTSRITLDVVRALAACGVGCKGELAGNTRDTTGCGLPGAIMSAIAWQSKQRSPSETFDAGLQAVQDILSGKVEPRLVLTDPPGKLAP